MDYILYLKDKSIHVVELKKLDRLSPCPLEIGWQDDAALETFLKALPESASISLVIDFSDETIHFEWLPKLLPWEKPALAKRLVHKAKSEGAVFVHTDWMNVFRKNNDGRDEQQFLISSVFQSDDLHWLLSALEEAQASIKSMYSYAFLVEAFFKATVASKLKLGRKKLKQPFMLVFREDQYHFRQIFFFNGRLRISRHIELDNEIEGDGALNHALIHETRVAVKYLYNQKIIPFNSEVSFVYLNAMDGDEQAVVELYRQEIATSNWDAVNTFMLGAALADSRANKAEQCQPLAHLSRYLAKAKLPSYYVNPYVEKIRLLNGLKLGFTFSSAALGLLLLYYVVSMSIDQYLLWHKMDRVEFKTENYIVEKARLQNNIQLRYDAEDIKETVTFSEQLLKAKLAGHLGIDVKGLAAVLSRHPHILMDELEWSGNQKFDAKQVNLKLHGWVLPFETSYQKPVEWVDALVKDFDAADFTSQVTLVQEPLDRSLKKALSIEGSELGDVHALPFAIQMTIGQSDASTSKEATR